MDSMLRDAAVTALLIVDARIHPKGGRDVRSRDEAARLKDAFSGGMHDLPRHRTRLRQCRVPA